jgi:hypothetical protein
MPLDWAKVIPFKRSPEEILATRESGQIYSADFNSGEGKYISTVFDTLGPVDAVIKISARIELRLTYIFNDKTIHGIQLLKVSSDGRTEKIHLSTLDWKKVLDLLHIFDEVDLESVASGTLILDKSIVSNPEDLEKFLNTIITDPEGKKKFKEVAKNFTLFKSGDIDKYASRQENTKLMAGMLNNSDLFKQLKEEKKIGKDEEVWQQFYKENEWILCSEVIQILEERDIDEDSTVDLPVEGFDGFLDIIELKLPTASFWTQDINPTAELIKAIMQCMRYVIEYERRINDAKKLQELGVSILKPRITLIYGRSNEWDTNMKERFRILNSSFHNITILTYDHVLQRAERLSGYKK